MYLYAENLKNFYFIGEKTMKIEDIALTLIPNLTPLAVAHLLEVFGSAEAIYAASEAELISRAGLRADIAKKIVAGYGLPQAAREIESCQRAGITVVASCDRAYPERVRFCADYPHIIYMVGDTSLPNSSTLLAIVGERQSVSGYGNKMILKLIEQIAELMPEAVIVGMLESCTDATALRIASTYGLQTIAISSVALSELSCSEYSRLADEILTSGGAIVSEVGSASALREDGYSADERIVAGLSDGVVVVESGDVPNIAKCADSYSRMLFALPGRATDVTSWGTNRMIASSMAHLVCSGRDIVNILDSEL